MNEEMKNKELVSRYADDEVTLQEREYIERLLKEDKSLYAYYKELSKLDAILNERVVEELSSDWEHKVQASLGEDVTKEDRMMKKSKLFKVSVGGGALVTVLIVGIVLMQTYAQRALQSRVGDASTYLAKHTDSLGSTVQYEPYYLSTDYAVDRSGSSGGYDASNVPQGTGVPESQIQAGTITAGDIEDNLNLNSYRRYVDEYLQTVSGIQLPFVVTNDRVIVKVVDKKGNAVKNVKIVITQKGNQKKLFESYTHSDGLFYLFPSFDGVSETDVTITVISASRETISKDVDLSDGLPDEPVEFILNETVVAADFQLDLMFVIDGTGSMGDELNYLKKEFTDLIRRVKNEHSNVSIRYGLTMYRDEGDEYVVKKFPFTTSVSTMQRQIEEQYANGGGNYEEAVHKAMKTALEMDWSQNSTKMIFFVADAPPHNQFIEQTWNSAKEARRRGIHIYPVAASGVGDVAEYLMRSMSLITQGRYLFLTDDSGVGNTHKEPSIPCYVVTRLNDLMVRVISSVISGERVEPESNRIIRRSGNYNEGVCEEAYQ